MKYEYQIPIGIMPKYIWDDKRFHELCLAITRYYSEGLEIPIEWIEEYNEYIRNKKK
jgi:hypothetical protein